MESLLRNAARLPATLAELTADGAGTRLVLQADSLEWTAGVLAGLEADFRIVRPDELREHVAQLSARLAGSAGAARAGSSLADGFAPASFWRFRTLLVSPPRSVPDPGDAALAGVGATPPAAGFAPALMNGTRAWATSTGCW